MNDGMVQKLIASGAYLLETVPKERINDFEWRELLLRYDQDFKDRKERSSYKSIILDMYGIRVSVFHGRTLPYFWQNVGFAFITKLFLIGEYIYV